VKYELPPLSIQEGHWLLVLEPGFHLRLDIEQPYYFPLLLEIALCILLFLRSIGWQQAEDQSVAQ
jgi:hypothetical protein